MIGTNHACVLGMRAKVSSVIVCIVVVGLGACGGSDNLRFGQNGVTEDCNADLEGCTSTEENFCGQAPPVCPEGTRPGILNGCWSDHCISDDPSENEQTKNECEDLVDNTCIPNELHCDDDWTPVCGCDGMTYSNECYAENVCVQIERQGVCPGFGSSNP